MDKDELSREGKDKEIQPEEAQGISLREKFLFCLLILVAALVYSAAVVPAYFPQLFYKPSRPWCRIAEADAMNVMAALASYFSEPENMRIPSIETLKSDWDTALSLNNDNPEPTIWPPEGSNAYHYNTIRVTVYDNSGQCPRGSAYIATCNVTIAPSCQGGYWQK